MKMMKKNLCLTAFAVSIFCFESCKRISGKEKGVDIVNDVLIENGITDLKEFPKKNKIEDFLPSGFGIFKEAYGDLNNDGLDDCVIIIHELKKDKSVKPSIDRKGIIVLLNEENNYVLAAKNTNCFSSENENGIVYFAPELGISIDKGNICVNYSHGEYGYWRYTFNLKNSDIVLIGYDSNDNFEPVNYKS